MTPINEITLSLSKLDLVKTLPTVRGMKKERRVEDMVRMLHENPKHISAEFAYILNHFLRNAKADREQLGDIIMNLRETSQQLEADKEVLVNTLTSVSTKSYDLEKEMRDLKKRAS